MDFGISKNTESSYQPNNYQLVREVLKIKTQQKLLRRTKHVRPQELGSKIKMGYSRHFTVKYTFINHWRDAVVTNIRKPAARFPRMGNDCDSSQCQSVLLLQYQKLLKYLVQAPQHTDLSPAICDRVHGLPLERCNVQLLRQPDATELLRSEVSAPHKQNPFIEIRPMPGIPKLHYHRLRCFIDIHMSVTLSTPPPHLLWGSPTLLNGHRGFFLTVNRRGRKADH